MREIKFGVIGGGLMGRESARKVEKSENGRKGWNIQH